MIRWNNYDNLKNELWAVMDDFKTTFEFPHERHNSAGDKLHLTFMLVH